MVDEFRTTITAHTFTATRRAREGKKIFHEGSVPTGSEVTDNEVDECINGEREREKRDSKLLTDSFQVRVEIGLFCSFSRRS